MPSSVWKILHRHASSLHTVSVQSDLKHEHWPIFFLLHRQPASNWFENKQGKVSTNSFPLHVYNAFIYQHIHFCSFMILWLWIRRIRWILYEGAVDDILPREEQLYISLWWPDLILNTSTMNQASSQNPKWPFGTVHHHVSVISMVFCNKDISHIWERRGISSHSPLWKYWNCG